MHNGPPITNNQASVDRRYSILCILLCTALMMPYVQKKPVVLDLHFTKATFGY